MIIKLMKAFLKTEIVSGSFILLIGALCANLFNFLFNLYMTRNLSIANYGIFASLISLITLLGILAGAIIPTVIRFAAEYFANKELDKIRGLFLKVFKVSFIIGLISLISIVVFSKEVGSFFKIQDNFLLFFTGFTILVGYIGTVNNALLQAKLSFKFLTLSNFIGTFIKFSIGILLVYLGFSVTGAMIGFSLSIVIPYLLSFIPLSFLFKSHIKPVNLSNRDLFYYGTPSAIALFGLNSLISTDIIIVKHFFSPSQAGMYAGLSIIARVIFFLSAPITSVMFPLVVQKHTRKQNYKTVFKMALLMVFLPSILLSFFYFVFPEFTIKFFTKSDYLNVKEYLGLFGLFTTTFSLLSIFVNFFLSIRKTEIYIPVAFAALSQAFLIWMFHKDFFQVILISLSISVSLLIFCVLYYRYKIDMKYGT